MLVLMLWNDIAINLKSILNIFFEQEYWEYLSLSNM